MTSFMILFEGMSCNGRDPEALLKVSPTLVGMFHWKILCSQIVFTKLDFKIKKKVS